VTLKFLQYVMDVLSPTAEATIFAYFTVDFDPSSLLLAATIEHRLEREALVDGRS
jgi:hypothetical protein